MGQEQAAGKGVRNTAFYKQREYGIISHVQGTSAYMRAYPPWDVRQPYYILNLHLDLWDSYICMRMSCLNNRI